VKVPERSLVREKIDERKETSPLTGGSVDLDAKVSSLTFSNS